MHLDATLICLIAGPIIAILVSAFKKLPVVASYPKAVALLLSVILSLVSGLTFGEFEWAAIAECIIVPFMGSVASYEVAKSSVSTTDNT